MLLLRGRERRREREHRRRPGRGAVRRGAQDMRAACSRRPLRREQRQRLRHRRRPQDRAVRCGPYPLRLHMRVIPMSVEGSVRSLALLLVLYASAAHAASATANVFTCPISPGTQITVPVGIRLGSIPLASYVVDVGYYPPVIAPRSRDARPPQRGVGRHRLRHDHALVLKHGCSHRDGRPRGTDLRPRRQGAEPDHRAQPHRQDHTSAATAAEEVV